MCGIGLAGDDVKKALDFEGVEDTLVLQPHEYESQAKAMRDALQKQDAGGLRLYPGVICSGRFNRLASTYVFPNCSEEMVYLIASMIEHAQCVNSHLTL